MANENSLVININGSAKNFLDELDKIKGKTKSLEQVLSKTAKASAVLFAGFAASIAVVTKSFIDYEKALIGVGKTTNIEGVKLRNLGKEFQKLASTIPLSTNELLGIGQAAAQLGVKNEDIIQFTETIAKLGVATDLTGEQAATSITRILNVTGEAISTIPTFGSVLVSLGNQFAATESEIVKMTTEVARSTAIFGVSAGEAAGLSTALKSIGVQAQLGGSVVGRAFRSIDKTIRDGGTGLDNLAKLTGIAGDQLKQTFKDDSTFVFQSFIEGLGEIQAAGGSVTEALEAFGLSGDEINKVLPVLAKNSGLVAKTLKVAADETKNATALNDEAADAFASLGSAIEIGRNNLTNLATNIGEKLAPTITALVESLSDIAKTMSEADEATISGIATFLKWGAIISGAVAAITSYILGAIGLAAAIVAIDAAFLGGAIAASTFWVAVTGPIGLAVLGVAALAAGFVALKAVFDKDDPPKSLEQINDELKEIDKQIDKLKTKSKGALSVDELVNLKELKKAREELEKLAAAKEAAAKDTAVLSREFEGPLAGFDEDIFGDVGPESIPLKGKPEIEQEENAEAERNAKLQAGLDDKQKLIDKATAKRVESAKIENEQLKAIKAARDAEETEEDKANAEKKAEIENQIREAKKIKDAEERALAIENIKLKNEEELEAIEEHDAAKAERDLERKEEKAALDEELAALSKEQRDALTAEDIAQQQAALDTKAEAQNKASVTELKRKVAERNQFQQDEIKFGTNIAKLKQFFASQEVQGAKNAANQLVQLTNSKNSTLKGIGKAAARTQAAIKTAEGAISAYASLSGIPIVGPVLGGLAAAAIVAYGVEQQQKISSAAQGGFVPPTQGGSRDRVPMFLEPDELVVPSAIAPNFIQSVGNPSSGDFANDDASAPDGGGGGSRELHIMGDLVQNEEFVSALATELRESQEFDNVRL